MNKIVKKIKVLLGMVKEQFETARLADGSEISFDSLEINREIYDSEGNPLASGEYTLEDGTKIEVDENGVVKEIERPDGEVEKEEVVTEMEEEPVAKVDTDTTVTDAGKNENGKPTDNGDAKEVVTETTETTETVVVPEETSVEEKIKVLEGRVDSLEKALDECYELILRISEKMKEEEVKVTETVEAFSKLKSQPSAEPIHFGKQTIKEEKTSPAERFLQLKQTLKNK